MTTDQLIERIRNSVIGDTHVIAGPYGPRRVTYADYTASGRALSFIEDAIRDHVLPTYANTHSESSATGRQTQTLREDARQIIHSAVHGDDSTVILFCGSGATGAIDKLIGLLGIRLPAGLEDTYRLSSAIPARERPVVFVGPYEHHSNEISWRETIADVVTIGETPDGHIDIDQLEQELRRYADRPVKIGAFSAASNVTGILTDTCAIAHLLHEHQALSFWDYAAAAPYVDITMSPQCPEHPLAYKDAVVLSPHKLIGGPGTPGVLAVRRDLISERRPVVPGGGTVEYVSESGHLYLDDPVAREEGGTPAIIESIRAGLVFALKQRVGTDVIRAREHDFLQRALTSWAANPRVEMLGSPSSDRLSIVSFLIRSPEGRFLHHNFVVALLNDLFGIQARGGCSCAGPYGHRLLGIDAEQSQRFLDAIGSGCEGIKPGWVRVNFNYFISDAVADFIIDAVNFVADEGAKFLGDYAFDQRTGRWEHQDGRSEVPLRLSSPAFDWALGTTVAEPTTVAPDSALQDYLAAARRLAAQEGRASSSAGSEAPTMSTMDFEGLRWFELPGTRALPRTSGTG